MATLVKSVASTKLIYIRKGSAVEQAQELMREHRIRHLPVVDEVEGVIGVLSTRDIAHVPVPQQTRVESVMSAPVEFFKENVSLRTVILHMLEKKISCVLVSDAQNEMVGIVTTDDLLWHLASLLKEERNHSQAFSSVMSLQTIGQVANQLSTMGF